MSAEIGLPEALERAASALPRLAGQIRPANGDPARLARELGPAEARELLTWLLAHETASGEELALEWADDPATDPLVLGLEPAGLPKPARKVLARLAHRLRSRGMEVPAPAPAPRATTLAPVDERIDEARISAPDPYGSRVAYLAADRAGGGVRIFQIVFDEERGVRDFDLFESGRSRARRFLRELPRRAAWPAVAVPPVSVRALIAEAVSHHPGDRALPRGFGDWRARLCEHPDDAPTPGALARGALGAGDEIDPERVEGWLRAGALGPWPPPVEGLKPLLERLDEIASGQLIVSGAAREQQIEAALEEALDADRHERLARRFEETAYVWWKTGREADARQALAAATSFRASAPEARRLARAMLELALAPALERARSGEERRDAAPADPAQSAVSG